MPTTLFTELPPLMTDAAPTAGPRVPANKTVALITQDNGVGLSVDMELLGGVLIEAGYKVMKVNWRNAAMPRVDIGIFLELYNHRLAGYARKRIGIFNPEWFMPKWRIYLPTLSQVWAKSAEAQELFGKATNKCVYTGFLSRDFGPSEAFERRAVHLMGHSSLKNTQAVLDAWAANPDLPPLTVIAGKPIPVPANVTLLGRLSDEDLRHQLATARFHICPSRAEGWGHYITEALTLGAYVVTTDASPMNEHVHADWGALVPVTRKHPRFHVYEYDVSPDDIAAAVRRADALDDKTLQARGQLGRQHVLNRNRQFTTTALNLLERL